MIGQLPVNPAPAAPNMEVMTAIPEAPVKMAADPLPRTATAPAPIKGAAKPADKAEMKSKTNLNK